MASMSIRILRSCRTCSPTPPLSCLACIHFSPFSSPSITPSPSSSNPQTPQPPIALFLHTECKFSSTQISKFMQTRKSFLKTRSPHTARKAVEFLKQWGFTQPQLHNTILRNPSVLALKVNTQLKPKFHYFRSLGFTDQELKHLISVYPRVLSLNLERNIIPKVSFLENLFGTKQNLIKALKGSPPLLVQSVEKKMKPKLDFFKQCGIQGELLLFLFSISPRILGGYSLEVLRVRMEYAMKTLGVVQASKHYVYGMCVFLINAPQILENKIKHLQCLGFMDHEVRELVIKNPWLLAYSTNKMQENMEFLTQIAGLKPKDVFSNSSLLQYSVKKRLLPRHAVFKALSSEQQFVPSLITIFTFSERSFLEKIVECHPQASMLKEIHKAKIDSECSNK